MKNLFAALAGVLLAASSTWAAEADAEAIFRKMKAALEPDAASVRTIRFTVHSESFDDEATFEARQVRKKLADGKSSLTVITSPKDLKNITVLVLEQGEGEPNEQYFYLPVLRRVRRLGPLDSAENFLTTDFSYANLGLLETSNRSFSLLGTEKRRDRTYYEIEERPRTSRRYSRIVTLIDQQSMWPLERRYYDLADRLWKKQTWEKVMSVNGTPTPVRVRMQDEQSGDWSEMSISGVRYGVELDEALFDPKALRETVTKEIPAQSIASR